MRCGDVVASGHLADAEGTLQSRADPVLRRDEPATRLRVLIAACAIAVTAAANAIGAPLTFDAILDGPSEAVPTPSPGTGVALVTIDTVTHSLEVEVEFANLLGPTTASHIHCCTAVPGAGAAGVATPTPTFPGFPLGVLAQSYAHTFDTSSPGSWNAAFIASHGGTPLTAEAALLAGLIGGTAYLNIHTSLYPGGEIRGFLRACGPNTENPCDTPTVPEPGSLALLGLGLAGLAAARRRNH